MGLMGLSANWIPPNPILIEMLSIENAFFRHMYTISQRHS